MHNSRVFSLLANCGLLAGVLNTAQAVSLNVAAFGGNITSPLQYGAMFEDINHSGDGGIYAELIQNRAFQAIAFVNATTDPWFAMRDAVLTVQNTDPLSTALPFSINVQPTGTSRTASLVNPGWWGISVEPQTYQGSFWVRGAYVGSIEIALRSNLTTDVFATTSVAASSKSTTWTEYTYTLTPAVAAPNSNNTLAITFDAAKATDGSLNFNLISLVPPTYKNRPNGNRVDLMQALADLTPSFFRMPGGNNIEGQGLAEGSFRWKWNETIGPLIDRPGRLGTWGYYNTDGLGLVEYLNWCVDLNMEPLLAVWAGQYLDGTSVTEDALGPYVQDVLNELEYIMGSTDTTFGALRASHGHPEPWKVNYVEIGNEDNLSEGLPSYIQYRFMAFYDAIKAVYPNINIIASTVAIDIPAGSIGDYHQYTRPNQFVDQFSYFDQDPTTSMTLIGAYATVQLNIPGGGIAGTNWSAPRVDFPFWEGSVAEAVFSIGTERNAGKILGASYAPGFQNLNSFEWTPDLISFTADPSQTVLSTSHHVIALLSGTRMTETRAVVATGEDADLGPMYWVAGQNTGSGSYIFKAAVYNSTGDVPVTLAFAGVRPGTVANLTVLTAPDAMSYADIGSDPVVTSVYELTAGRNGFTFELPNLSVAVLSTQARRGYGGWGGNNGWKGFGGYGGCRSGHGWTANSWTQWGKGNGC